MVGYTPMIQQYLQIKKNYKDAILFFRLGDFYEMFFDDAEVASRELEIVLTGRDAGGDRRIPMCGIPYHAAETYIAKLIDRNYKVAICEQVEDPRLAKGIVQREVIRVVTPGTVLESKMLEDKNHNYIVSFHINPREASYSLAVADISTGLFMCTQFNGDNGRNALLDELARLRPSEVVTSQDNPEEQLIKTIKVSMGMAVSFCNGERFLYDQAAALLEEQFGPGWQFNATIGDLAGLCCAAGGLLAYIEDTQKRKVHQIKDIQIYSTRQYMMLDASTRRNLELTASIRDNARWGTLLWVLDHTVTALGGRLLKNWLEQPLLDAVKIEERLDALTECHDNIIKQGELRKLLSDVYDLERLAARVVYGTANARDLLALKRSLSVLPEIKTLVQTFISALWVKTCSQMHEFRELCQLLDRALVDDPPVSLREGRLIKPGYNREVDELREASSSGKSWLAGLEARERERTGIRTLKVGYNKIFGYFFEITRANLGSVPPEYIRKQTLANAERYITPELKQIEDKILGAEDRLVQLEYQLFVELREQISGAVGMLQQTARAIARTDVLQSLTEAAVRGGYTRPLITDQGPIAIKDGRHPVVEKVLGPGNFVPNDILLDEDKKLIILTGPNMAGKSTYMRQVALLVLMAQTGSFIPAAGASIGIVDRIFTRVGAADDLAGGQSTFMVEMNECQVIVSNATHQSLIIMDEVGRGTSTYDGISIARALVEHIAKNIKAKTIFSTHYHELTDLDGLPGIVNYTVAVEEKGEEVIFLRRVLSGKADRSYGIQVAKLAGLPPEILNRAEEVLHAMETKQAALDQIAAGAEPADAIDDKCQCDYLSLSSSCLHPLIRELDELDLLNTTPLESITLLSRWQKQLRECFAAGGSKRG